MMKKKKQHGGYSKHEFKIPSKKNFKEKEKIEAAKSPKKLKEQKNLYLLFHALHYQKFFFGHHNVSWLFIFLLCVMV